MKDIVTGAMQKLLWRTLKSGLWTGRWRNQKETQVILLPCCWEIMLAASPVTRKWLTLGTGTMPEPGLGGPEWTSARKAACVTSGAHCLPPLQPSGGSFPVYTDTLFVSIGACLAGGPTHPECCFGMKLGMEPDATENLGKGSLPSEAGRAGCSFPQGFKRESQVDIFKNIS